MTPRSIEVHNAMADSYPPEQRPSQAAARLEDRKPVLLPRASSSTTTTTTMLSERYILEPSPDYPLYIFAKRYWAPEFEQHAKDPAAATLIVLHSTSFHKETWEPALEDLFSLAVQSKSLGLIREAWTIDCPNHGEAGERNRHTLRGPDFIHFSCEKYAEAVHRFLTYSPGGVSFRRRRLIGIGHSLGANTMIILQSIQPVMDFAKLIIVEPMVSPEGPEMLAMLRERLVRRARKRTKCWPTLEEAKKDYGQPKRHGAKWDPRVLDLFINHALHWKTKVQSFGLSCMRQQEVAMYMDEEGPVKPVTILNELCSRLPVHLVLGGVHDLIPPGVHTTLVDPKSGRTFATVKTLPEVGHLIPQESPTELAAHIFEVLSNSPGLTPSRL